MFKEDQNALDVQVKGERFNTWVMHELNPTLKSLKIKSFRRPCYLGHLHPDQDPPYGADTTSLSLLWFIMVTTVNLINSKRRPKFISAHSYTKLVVAQMCTLYSSVHNSVRNCTVQLDTYTHFAEELVCEIETCFWVWGMEDGQREKNAITRSLFLLRKNRLENSRVHLTHIDGNSKISKYLVSTQT